MLFRGCRGGGPVERLGRRRGDRLSAFIIRLQWFCVCLMQDSLVKHLHPHADWVDRVDRSHTAGDPLRRGHLKLKIKKDNSPMDRNLRPATFYCPFRSHMSCFCIKCFSLLSTPSAFCTTIIHHYICHSDIGLHLYQFEFIGLILACH
jgi:hypothetical protein